MFLFAAGAKLFGARDFLIVVRYLVPDTWESPLLVRVLAALILTWELFVGMWVLLPGAGRGAPRAAGITLGVFSVALGFLLADQRAPTCGCFGAFGVSSRTLGLVVALVRNAGLLWLVVLDEPSRGSVHPRHPVPEMRPRPAQNAGFTLVELLVVIATAGTLLSLVVGGLARSHRESRITRSLAIQRQLSASVSAYCTDYQDGFPYFATPGEIYTHLTLHGTKLAVDSSSLLDQSRYWACGLSPEYIDASPIDLRYWGDKGSLAYLGLPEFVFRTRFRMTYTIFAAPEYFAAPFDPRVATSALRQTRMSEVLFPSAKGLTLDAGSGIYVHTAGANQEDMGLCSLVDGSGRRFHPFMIDAANFVGPPLVDWVTPVMSTRDGLRGQDFR